MNTWLAGAATREFQVPPGSYLGGYADRAAPSTGTSDSLEVSALVVTAADTTLHVLSADLIAVDPDLVTEIAATCGVESHTIVLAASHTHSGPLGVPLRLHPASHVTADPPLRQAFVEVAAEALTAARAHLEPATLTAAETLVSGVWSNRNDPLGPCDHRVRTLMTHHAEGRQVIAMMLLLPTHPTILGAWNLRVSADLHGGVRRALRRLGGIDIPILAATGAAGDSSTRYTRQESSLAEVERMGDIVASSILDTPVTATPLVASLQSAHGEIVLTPRKLDRTRAKAELNAAVTAWQNIGHSPDASDGDNRVAWTRVQGAEIQVRIAGLQPKPAPLSAWRLGNHLTLATIPGELFTSLGRHIERHSSPEPTWIIGYANGYVGYLVDDDAVYASTYEALASPWSADAGMDLAAASTGLIRSLRIPDTTS